MKTWLSKFRCINCSTMYDILSERKFKCHECQYPLEVVHQIPDKPRGYWTSLFDKRHQSMREISGIWQFREWIMPDVKPKQIVTLGEGNVAIVPAGNHLRKWLGGKADVWLSLRGKNPTGAFKDDGMTAWITVAMISGARAGVCSSTGDTSASSGAYCAAAGIPCMVLLPKGHITNEQVLQVKLFGAHIVMVPAPFDKCMEILQELVEHYGAYPSNSMHPARIEGHQGMLFQAVRFFGWELPEWVVGPVGNGSDLSSIDKARHTLHRAGFTGGLRILGSQSDVANPLTKSWQEGCPTNLREWRSAYEPVSVGDTIATAMRIGNPYSHIKVMRAILDSRGTMEQASDEEIKEAVFACARDGHFVCPQSGAALAGLRRAIQKCVIKGKERVLVVCTADGMKFTAPFSKGLLDDIVYTKGCDVEEVANIINERGLT